MPRFIEKLGSPRFAGPVAFSLLLAAASGPAGADDSAKPAPKPTTTTTTTGKSKEPATSVKENVKQLGREVTAPGALQRIKAHEQEFEKKVERTRDRQRKDHGAARPSDAVDLAKSLDKPEGGGAPAKADAKKKAEAPPAPPAR